uniref:Uncharacterized protein n=1 Tax=Trichuris muris TaxID=70415 RepID=A0A5S6Q004_TRIMR
MPYFASGCLVILHFSSGCILFLPTETLSGEGLTASESTVRSTRATSVRIIRLRKDITWRRERKQRKCLNVLLNIIVMASNFTWTSVAVLNCVPVEGLQRVSPLGSCQSFKLRIRRADRLSGGTSAGEGSLLSRNPDGIVICITPGEWNSNELVMLTGASHALESWPFKAKKENCMEMIEHHLSANKGVFLSFRSAAVKRFE